MFVKDTLYPFLLENTEHIDDAFVFTMTLDNVIKQAFNQLMIKVKIRELNLRDYIIDGPKGDKYHKLLDILKEESIISASVMLSGFSREMESSMRVENQKKQLKDLPITLLGPDDK